MPDTTPEHDRWDDDQLNDSDEYDLHFYNDEECESLQYHNEQYDDEQYDDEQYDDDDDDEQYDNDCYNDHGVPRSTMYRPSKAARLV